MENLPQSVQLNFFYFGEHLMVSRQAEFLGLKGLFIRPYSISFSISATNKKDLKLK